LSRYDDDRIKDAPALEGHLPLAGVTQRWHVLWTKSNCEQAVYEQLMAGGFDVLLPTVDKWSRRKHTRCLYSAPLFPGYLFVRHAMDKAGYIEINKARGLVRILGERWDKLATVPDDEIDAIRRVNQSDLPRMPHPYLKIGQTVRIISGPLANVQGVFVREESKRGLLVLSIELLRRSLAVEVDCTLVTTI
jgi:transcriptional antiterminator NusG